MSKKWLLLVGLTVGVFVALVGYGDFSRTIGEIGSLPIRHLFVGLGLAFSNFPLRFQTSLPYFLFHEYIL